jgi:hypothetical protein
MGDRTAIAVEIGGKLSSDHLAELAVNVAALIAAGDALASALEEAESQHIYDFDNGDVQDADCGYRAARRAWAEAKGETFEEDSE